MQKGECIDPFLTRIQEVCDQLVIVREVHQPTELVQMALNNVSKEWQVFVQSILGQDTLPRWDKMWSDLQQEKLRRALLKSTISKSNNKGTKGEKEEENVALASKGPSQGHGEKKKKDLSKVKCVRCGEFGHYSTQCPLKKKDKQEKHDQKAASAKIDKLSSTLEENFAMSASIPLGERWGRYGAIVPAQRKDGRSPLRCPHYLATGAHSIQ